MTLLRTAILAVPMTFAALAVQAACTESQDQQAVQECLAQDLRDSDKRINAVYKLLMASETEDGKTALRDRQRAWLKGRDKACALDNKESDREKWLQAILADQGKTLCVVRHTFARVTELDTELHRKAVATPELPAAPKAAPLVATTQTGGDSAQFSFLDDDYRMDSKARIGSGRRYVEVVIDRQAIAALGDILLNVEMLADAGGGVTTAVRIRSGQPGSVLSMGMALDLDNNYAYARQSGIWRSQPGSTTGIQLKPNRAYKVSIQGSSPLRDLMNRGLIRVNLGQRPFEYAMPDGYRPFAE